MDKMRRSRSRFIVEQPEDRLRSLEDEEVTRIYNEVCSDPDTAAYDRNLAEEMLGGGSVRKEEKTW